MSSQNYPAGTASTAAQQGTQYQLKCVFSDEQDADWKKRISPQLLSRLAHITKSAFAVFRVLNPDRRQLVLVCAVEGASAPRAKIPMSPPAIKHLHCWQDSDPFGSWGRVSVSASPKDYHGDWDSWTEEERAFVLWVREKAWFPIDFGNEEKGVIVMVRGERHAFEIGVVAAAWLTAQVEMIKRFPEPKQVGFLESINCLSLLREAPTENKLWRGVCHALASAKGMGWNRVWIFRESIQRSEFACVMCLGHANKVRWMDAVFSKDNQFVSLEAEIEYAYDLQQENDSLALLCLSPEPVSLTFPADEMETEFAPHTMNGDRIFLPMFTSLSGRFSSVFEDFNSTQKQRSSKTEAEFLEDNEVFFLPLMVGGKRHLILLSQLYADVERGPSPSLQLSTLFANHAARLAEEWGIAKSLEREDEDSSRDFPEELVQRVTSRVSDLIHGQEQD